jgi:hypothetical protein
MFRMQLMTYDARLTELTHMAFGHMRGIGGAVDRQALKDAAGSSKPP